MILGADISTYLEEKRFGAKFYDGGREVDPLDELYKNGVRCIRIRLWNDPYSEDGEPYLGGTCDTENLISLAKLVTERGFDVLLDFHYSDFWADPAKQMLPKAWRGYTFGELECAVYDFTRSTLMRLHDNGIAPAYIQIGNEITNGMLWPHGQLTESGGGERGNYENLCSLLKAGLRACREVSGESKLVLHLERSYDQAVYNEFFTNMVKYGVDYDMIGASYYPCWHGTFDEFFSNMEMCKKFGKEIIVMEMGYGFTSEGYSIDGKQVRLVTDGVFPDRASLAARYPLTPDGQAEFIEEFLRRARKAELYAVFWWEPLWLPGREIKWASEAGQAYIGESGKSTLNEWANQCLFDYDGQKLPGFNLYKI